VCEFPGCSWSGPGGTNPSSVRSHVYKLWRFFRSNGETAGVLCCVVGAMVIGALLRPFRRALHTDRRFDAASAAAAAWRRPTSSSDVGHLR
jgi:hypothetical protein